MMLAVLMYEAADDVMELAPRHYAAHHAYSRANHADGVLLMIGTFADAAADGAMAILVSPEAAVAFAESDPFVLGGVVKAYRVLEWAETLTQD